MRRTAPARAAAANPRHLWPNVLAPQGTWLFDRGSNFGWAIKALSGSRHTFVGPAPDWALGSRAMPEIEFDVEAVAPAAATGGEAAAGGGGSFAAVPCRAGAASQLWQLSPGVSPGDGKMTNVRQAGGKRGCWEIEAWYPNATQLTVYRPFFARFAPFFRRPFALPGFLAPRRRERAKNGGKWAKFGGEMVEKQRWLSGVGGSATAPGAAVNCSAGLQTVSVPCV